MVLPVVEVHLDLKSCLVAADHQHKQISKCQQPTHSEQNSLKSGRDAHRHGHTAAGQDVDGRAGQAKARHDDVLELPLDLAHHRRVRVAAFIGHMHRGEPLLQVLHRHLARVVQPYEVWCGEVVSGGRMLVDQSENSGWSASCPKNLTRWT